MTERVRSAYTRRAADYIELMSSMAQLHPGDRQLMTTWAEGLNGPVLDAGCGPGHWTAYLAGLGLDVRGVDLVPGFVDHARATAPGLTFDVGDLTRLPEPTGALGGVLAWYSLIHHDPSLLPLPLAELARVLRPGGGLLLGFFHGPTAEPFEHKVTTAWTWPLELATQQLEQAGFEVVETHLRTGPGSRPHGAVTARRRG